MLNTLKARFAMRNGDQNRQASRSEIAEAKKKALVASEKIPGWLSDQEAGQLFDLALALPNDKPVCCEIGSWLGKSSVVLGTALRFKKEAKLYCIDPFDLFDEIEP